MRKHHYQLQTQAESELNITTFMNLMVVLVPFLLITAVFSRITVVQLNLPSSTGGSTPKEIGFRPEVIVRKQGFEITNGKQVIASIPKNDAEYDFPTLSKYMVSLKKQYPDVNQASVLLEPQIPYDYLIQTMDAVRTVELPDPAAQDGVKRVTLFSGIAVGDAP